MKSTQRYNPVQVEKKWSKLWEDNKTFKVSIQQASKPFYNLMMFPYPSGEGLHVGHTYTFGGGDTYGRFKRMQSLDVFEPMGFDAFGIHSENYALKKDQHPNQLIASTTKYFKEEQLSRFGALFDWDHSVNTSDPDYYRYTQWIFIQLFKAGLAVRKKAKVDWCPSCKTVLADEQVIAGKCERCGTEVIQKDLEQWFFKITKYADRLLKNLETIDWSQTTKQMQRNWIGKSTGAEVTFKTEDDEDIKVYTTRLDTIFGATFLAIAPEHPLIIKDSKINTKLIKIDQQEIEAYLKEAVNKNEVERKENKDKSGIFTGSYAINPANNEPVPIYIADYVLMGYGSGAIMGVPGHDERDMEFAKKYGLDIVQVVVPSKKRNKSETSIEAEIEKNRTKNNDVFTDYGELINSGPFTGQTTVEASDSLLTELSNRSLAVKKTEYHLRDWLISRQRYWGPPIPMIYCQNCADDNKSWFDKYKSKLENGNQDNQMPGWFPVPEEQLPVKLPYIEDFKPVGTGLSPLAQDTEFVKVSCPNCGSEARRETDVSDTFLDSSWYFLRYPNVGEIQTDSVKPWSEDILGKWLPVDIYIGGNEHAVLHLLYSRFVTMVLHDLGYLNFEEPFTKFRAHGLVTYKSAKMSKSRGNVINPNDYFDSYGFDALKLYLLFIGPFEEGGNWTDRGISGTYRFLQRVWDLVNQEVVETVELNLERKFKLASTIKLVGDDIERLHFNTAISTLMGYTNYLSSLEKLSRQELETLIIMLAPLAPYLSEEAWQSFHGYNSFVNNQSVHNQRWPSYEESDLVASSVTVVIQVNGKYRGKLELNSANAEDEAEVKSLASKLPNVAPFLRSNAAKVVFVPGRLINFVV